MIGRVLERLIFASRWLLAPFYLGLALALVLLAIKFVQRLVLLVPQFLGFDLETIIVACLKLIDLTLVANLVLIVMLVGYENFVSSVRLTVVARPAWMEKSDFGDLKIKLFASIVAIAAVLLLEDFMDVAAEPWSALAWRIGILLAFAVAGLLVAVTDRIAAKREPDV